MRSEVIGLVDGKLVYRDETVGPRHDPYSRKTVERHRDGELAWRLVSCGLAGEWLEVGGEEVAKLSIMGESGDAHEAYREEVERLTGMDPYFWLEKVWGLRDSRLTPAEREMRDAEERLLRYAI